MPPMAQHVNTCLFSGSLTKMTSLSLAFLFRRLIQIQMTRKLKLPARQQSTNKRPLKSERRTTSVKRSNAVQHFRLMSWTLRDPSPTPGLRYVAGDQGHDRRARPARLRSSATGGPCSGFLFSFTSILVVTACHQQLTPQSGHRRLLGSVQG